VKIDAKTELHVILRKIIWLIKLNRCRCISLKNYLVSVSYHIVIDRLVLISNLSSAFV